MMSPTPLAQLQSSAVALFDDLSLSHDGVSVYATPRRLVIHAVNVTHVQPDVKTDEKGPPASRAFDADGNPTKAAQGFARGKGVDVNDFTGGRN